METLVVLMQSAVIVAVRLGLPLAVLFVIGYQIQKGSKRHEPVKGRRSRMQGLSGTSGTEVINEQEMGHYCWKIRGDVSEISEGDSARYERDMPCWAAVKTSLGRLKAECVDCEFFLAPPARR